MGGIDVGGARIAGVGRGGLGVSRPGLGGARFARGDIAAGSSRGIRRPVVARVRVDVIGLAKDVLLLRAVLGRFRGVAVDGIGVALCLGLRLSGRGLGLLRLGGRAGGRGAGL